MSEQGQAPRDHPGVTAVLTRPSDEHDPSKAARKHVANRGGCTTSGVLHQDQAGDAELIHGRTIDIARLLACKKPLHDWIMPLNRVGHTICSVNGRQGPLRVVYRND